MKESILEQYSIVRRETNLSHVMKYGDTSFVHWKIGVFQGNASEPPSTAAGSRLRPAQHAAVERRLESEGSGMLTERELRHSVSARHATIYSLQRRLAKAEAGLYGDNIQSAVMAAKLRVQLNEEYRLATIYDRAYTHLTGTFLGVSSVEEALAMPLLSDPEAGITQWSCYRAANDITQAECGKTTDYAMRYLRENARACELLKGNTATVLAVIKDSCRKAVTETNIKGPMPVNVEVRVH